MSSAPDPWVTVLTAAVDEWAQGVLAHQTPSFVRANPPLPSAVWRMAALALEAWSDRPLPCAVGPWLDALAGVGKVEHHEPWAGRLFAALLQHARVWDNGRRSPAVAWLSEAVWGGRAAWAHALLSAPGAPPGLVDRPWFKLPKGVALPWATHAPDGAPCRTRPTVSLSALAIAAAHHHWRLPHTGQLCERILEQADPTAPATANGYPVLALASTPHAVTWGVRHGQDLHARLPNGRPVAVQALLATHPGGRLLWLRAALQACPGPWPMATVHAIALMLLDHHPLRGTSEHDRTRWQDTWDALTAASDRPAAQWRTPEGMTVGIAWAQALIARTSIALLSDCPIEQAERLGLRGTAGAPAADDDGAGMAVWLTAAGAVGGVTPAPKLLAMLADGPTQVGLEALLNQPQRWAPVALFCAGVNLDAAGAPAALRAVAVRAIAPCLPAALPLTWKAYDWVLRGWIDQWSALDPAGAEPPTVATVVVVGLWLGHNVDRWLDRLDPAAVDVALSLLADLRRQTPAGNRAEIDRQSAIERAVIAQQKALARREALESQCQPCAHAGPARPRL